MKNKMSKEQYEAAMLEVAKEFGAKKITAAEALKKAQKNPSGIQQEGVIQCR